MTFLSSFIPVCYSLCPNDRNEMPPFTGDPVVGELRTDPISSKDLCNDIIFELCNIKENMLNCLDGIFNSPNEEFRDPRTLQLDLQLTMVVLQMLMIRLAPAIPFFAELDDALQFRLAKTASKESIGLWMVRDSIIDEDGIKIWFGDRSYTYQQLVYAGFGDMAYKLIEFAQLCQAIEIDDMECAFLYAISIVSNDMEPQYNSQVLINDAFAEYLSQKCGIRASTRRLNQLLLIQHDMKEIARMFHESLAKQFQVNCDICPVLTQLWDLPLTLFM